MDLQQFFKTVVTSGTGWFCLAHAQISEDERKTKESWTEEFFSYPDELPSIINRVRELDQDYDVYFSPYLFSEQSSKKQYAIAGRTIVADLDDANILTLQLNPTVLVESSEARHQGYWILKDAVDSEEHEALSKRLTYSIPRCDRTGWYLGKKVRVPETLNHKYKVGPQYVRVVSGTGRIYQNHEIEDVTTVKELFGTTNVAINEEDTSWAEQALVQDVGPQEMLARIRSSVPTTVARYNLQQRDRSVALWALYMELFRAGLPKEKVFYIAYHSVNNKFKDLRYGGIKELAKDVLRAELASKIQLPDVKDKIKQARKLGDNPIERSEYIARCVREHLDQLGSFIHCDDDTAWFIREDTGRPIQVATRSDAMARMLDTTFGINASEKDASYVTHSLNAMTCDLPVTGRVASLSYYDHEMRIFVLHTGRKDVLVVQPNSITRQTNGYQGVIFPWTLGSNAISPNYKALDRPWEDEVFDDCLNNVLGISKENAKAILKVWFLSVLLRDGLSSRPILALFGQPGSGKSTLFRRIYTILYGRDRGLGVVSKEEHFDHAMSIYPLVVLDNVDSTHKWLPDKLAATVGPTEITKRKLFTDFDTITIKLQAMVGITAHNPKFGREDVTDRLLLLTFERLEHFKSENIIYSKLMALRNALWGAILQDIQTVFKTDVPHEGYPQFRIEDFAQFGFWIAKALGIGQQFCEGLESISKEQKSFNLEEDAILIDAIERMIDREPDGITDLGAGALWLKLRKYCRDERGFDRRYSNAISLGRKLWTLIDSMREYFDVSWSVKKGVKIWTIRSKYELEEKVGTNGSAKI